MLYFHAKTLHLPSRKEQKKDCGKFLPILVASFRKEIYVAGNCKSYP